MGLFSKAKAYWEECKEYQRIYDERRMQERERDSRRPSITNLRFVTLNPAIADSPNLVKLKVKDKKAKEMFLDCIRSGRASFAEVLAIDSTLIKIDEDHSGFDSDYIELIFRCYVKVADLNGTVYKEIVLSSKDNQPVDWDRNIPWQKAENPDVVKVADYPHVYILHYYLGDKQYYMLVDNAEFNNLALILGRVRFVTFYKDLTPLELDKDCCCWWN